MSSELPGPEQTLQAAPNRREWAFYNRTYPTGSVFAVARPQWVKFDALVKGGPGR